VRDALQSTHCAVQICRNQHMRAVPLGARPAAHHIKTMNGVTT
jgi:hypothetical protein